MCGIYFFTKNSEINIETIKKSMDHRGPDFHGQVDLSHSILGHNLLSIRDNVDFSKQPIRTKNGNFVIAFNGEIYNTKYLKSKFEINSESESDTEILCKLIDKIGLKFIEHIKGMFAIIIYEKNTNSIHAYRDKSGQKILYYLENHKNFILTSEIHVVLESKKFKKTVDYNSVHEACLIGYNPNENTIFSNIRKLLPGEKLTYNISNNQISKSQFIQKKNDFNGANIYESVDETIKNHLLTKSKIAINISGGLDSNIILHHSLKYKPDIDLFCTFFENAPDEYNHDFKIATKISELYGLKIIKTNITENDYIDNFYKSFSFIEEPNRNIGNPGYFLNYINQSKLGFRSVLTGDGGDEIFVGYPWYRKGRIREIIYKNIFLSKIIKTPEITNYYENYDRYNSLNKHQKFFLTNTQGIKKNSINNSARNFKDFLNSSFDIDQKKIWNKKKLILDQQNWLSSEVLIRADKLSMRKSLEIRNPFCDHDLRTKIIDQLSETNFKSSINKEQIRSIYKDKLPKYVISEKKKFGWRCPHKWIENSRLKTQIIDLLPQQNSNFFDWKIVKNSLINSRISLMDRSIAPIISLIILNDYYKMDL
tara:strand:- start:898 stop:2679 length:1782 start_codon:yes stop_codon:yes gene_type:complete